MPDMLHSLLVQPAVLHTKLCLQLHAVVSCSTLIWDQQCWILHIPRAVGRVRGMCVACAHNYTVLAFTTAGYHGSGHITQQPGSSNTAHSSHMIWLCQAGTLHQVLGSTWD